MDRHEASTGGIDEADLPSREQAPTPLTDAERHYLAAMDRLVAAYLFGSEPVQRPVLRPSGTPARRP